MLETCKGTGRRLVPDTTFPETSGKKSMNPDLEKVILRLFSPLTGPIKTKAFEVYLCQDLHLFLLLSMIFSVNPSRTFFSKCPSRNYYCRMKCNSDEHAVKYCADWTICCRPKKIPLKKTKW
ncbi:beta-defensin 131A-like [Suricata suricatta]|uniref:beta-defensin 131A-like n=1 Tax=Suricata suricatta TaxID=37032 RepID=UPI0011556F7B|nr:beta-defensin 131A-like [Suricata suricatta]